MFYGFRPARNRNNPGDPPPKWGPLGKAGCLGLIAVVTVILTIALLLGMTRTDGAAGSTAGIKPTTDAPSQASAGLPRSGH